jgi:hypothetical protein
MRVRHRAMAAPTHEACCAVHATLQGMAHRIQRCVPDAELLGQGEGLAVVSCGRLDSRGIAMRGDVAEEPQGPRLISPCLVPAVHLEGLPGEGDGVVHAPD